MRTSLPPNHQKALERYKKLYFEYYKLGKEFKKLIKHLLKKSKINYVEIKQRTKSIKSFQDKMKRKKYKNPLKEIKDLCAIRVICSFPEEVNKIEKIIRDNFKLTGYRNQEKNISPYKFWYRSHHFEIILDNKHINKNQYQILKNFTVEVQVRTVFMDAWADMEHKINYKNEWKTSHETKRKLSRLSALLELADEQLEELSKKG